jgi:CubicO group peptidase (beta-lactamase class C family)
MIIVSIFLTSVCCHAQANIQSPDQFFKALESDKNINGNVLLAENGNILYRRSFGFADFENKKLNDDGTRFQFDSISKTITAVAVLQLREKGKLKLEDKLVKYFPTFPYPTISLRHLLTHTSGLPGNELFEETVTKNPDRVITNEDIIPELILRQRPLKFQPGERWSYSNSNFNLLALLVEKISGLKFEAYLKRNIFDPAKMDSAYVETTLINSQHLPAEAYYYDYPFPYSSNLVRIADSFSLPRFKIEYFNLYGLSGGGSIKGTTNDLYKFDQALTGETLLKAATLEEAFTPIKLNSGENAVADFGGVLKTWFGLGWFILDDNSAGKIVGHTGGRYGSQTMFLRNLDKKQAVIFFDNAESEGVYRHALTAMNILNNKPPLIHPKSLVRIYGRALLNNGTDFAIGRLLELKPDTVHYRLRESEMNDLGYYLLSNGYSFQALETFKVTILLFPESWNAYDSYAEGLWRTGKNKEAVRMYRKSIELNPDNEAGKQMLKKIENEN